MKGFIILSKYRLQIINKHRAGQRLKHATMLIKLQLLIAFTGTVYTNAQTTTDTTKLPEVRLYAVPNVYQNSANSLSVIDAKEINQSDGVIVTSILNKIPGVTMQQGTLNTNRITIRGIGARSQYGTSRLKAYFDNIPLTNGESETVIEDIDMETTGSITILKNPNNSRYGSGLGGVLLLKSNNNSRKSFVKTAATLGSFNLWKQTVAAGFSNSTSALNIYYNHLQNDGFRNNSSYNRHSATITATHSLNETNKLSFLAIFTKLKAYIPSSVNQTDFLNQPEVAASNWAEAEGYESYNKLLLGLTYDVSFSAKLSLATSIFGSYKNAYEPRPFDILDDDTQSLGLRSALNYQSKLFNHETQWTFGGEFLTEDYTFTLFENLYQSQPGNGSIEGSSFAKTNQQRRYISLFAEQTTNINSKLFIEAGISLHLSNYGLKDVFETAQNNQQRYHFDNVVSPRLGWSYKFLPNQNIFASVSKGFSIPSVAETLTPEGRINTTLKPESGSNYEAGIKSGLFKNKLYTEIVFYSTQIRNLLVARRTAEDQYIGINAGKSSHKGIEFSTKYNRRLSGHIEISPYLTASINRFRFKDFVDDGNDYSGNKLTGAPNYQWQTGLDIQTDFGLNCNISLLNIGRIPMNDANTHFTSPYTIANIRTSYSFTFFKQIETQIAAGINNVFDKHYAAAILPNAVGFGTALPRYYYPGNPVNVYSNVSLVYGF